MEAAGSREWVGVGREADAAPNGREASGRVTLLRRVLGGLLGVNLHAGGVRG